MICIKCGDTFQPFKNKPGRVNECIHCAEEHAVKYTGNVIYDHKTCAMIQINKDPRLTEYINNATKLQCKGSNLGNNLKVNSAMAKSNGCAYEINGRTNAKGRG